MCKKVILPLIIVILLSPISLQAGLDKKKGITNVGSSNNNQILNNNLSNNDIGIHFSKSSNNTIKNISRVSQFILCKHSHRLRLQLLCYIFSGFIYALNSPPILRLYDSTG